MAHTVTVMLGRLRQLALPGDAGKSAPTRVLVVTVVGVFVAEAAVMGLLALLPPLTTVAEAFLDASVLSVLVIPILFVTVVRPLLVQIERRRRSERELERSRSLLEEAQRVARFGHWEWDLAAGRMTLSQEAGRVFGLHSMDPDSGVEGILEVVHEEDRQRFRKVLEEALRSKLRCELDFRVIDSSGHEHSLHCQGEVLRDRDDRATHMIGVVHDITERLRVQRTLEEAYAELDRRIERRTWELAEANRALRQERSISNAVVDTSGALIIVLDTEGHVVRFNRACEAKTGFTAEEVSGRRFWTFLVPEEERSGVLAAFNELRQGDFPNHHENHWLTRDGTKRFIRWANTAILDAAGNIEYLVGTGLDVTEQRQAERALVKSEERLRTILRTAQDGFWTLDPEGVLIDVNDAYCSLSGYSRDELVGTHLTLVEVDEDAGKVARHVARVRESGHDRFETRHRRKDGTVIDVEVSVTYLPELGQFYAFLRDITERNRNAAELARRRAELEAIIDSNTDAIVFTDVDRRIALINPAFTEMFGYGIEEVRGRTTHFLDVNARPEDATVDAAEDVQLEDPGVRAPFVVRCRRKDGSELWVETLAVPVRDASESLLGFVGVHRDITQRREAEATIRASLREKEVLLKEIHHRVKNNLQVVASLLHLQAEHAADEQHVEPLLQSQARIRSLALIHEKLYRSPDLAHIDFPEYVRDLARAIVNTIVRVPSDLDVVTDVEMVTFGLDTAIPLALIITELVSNSVKHGFSDGRKGTVRVGLRRGEAGRFLLIVEDDGIGPPVELDVRRTSSLGLQLVEVLAAQLHGTLRWERGEGSRFLIDFDPPGAAAHQ